MKYFFNFETYNRSGKINNKEMFYLRLLKKRMKENYEIFRKPHPMSKHMHKNYNDNMFNGNIIEFFDKKAFSKFKLDYSGLLNPKINDWKSHIYRITSFETEDNFIEEAESLYNGYYEAEAVILRKIEAERMCENHNNYMSSIKRSIEDMQEKIVDVCNFPIGKFVDESNINSAKIISENMQQIKDIIYKTPIIEMKSQMYYYEHPEITKIKTKYDTYYKELYSNIQTHDIP